MNAYIITKHDDFHFDTVLYSISSTEYLDLLKQWDIKVKNNYAYWFFDVNMSKCSCCGRILTERWRKYIRTYPPVVHSSIEINVDAVAVYCNVCGQNKLYGLLLNSKENMIIASKTEK